MHLLPARRACIIGRRARGAAGLEAGFTACAIWAGLLLFSPRLSSLPPSLRTFFYFTPRVDGYLRFYSIFRAPPSTAFPESFESRIELGSLLRERASRSEPIDDPSKPGSQYFRGTREKVKEKERERESESEVEGEKNPRTSRSLFTNNPHPRTHARHRRWLRRRLLFDGRADVQLTSIICARGAGASGEPERERERPDHQPGMWMKEKNRSRDKGRSWTPAGGSQEGEASTRR